MANDNSNWERATLEKLAMGALAEQKRARRWGIFFKLLGFAYVTFIAVMAMGWKSSGDRITAALRRAFKDSNTQGVILRVNSPGGSPVQSGIIYDEIRRLRTQYPNTPLYAVVEDMCASGGYYIASAADRIYVDKASLIGSIGVILGSFGFTGTMEKLGVDRRVVTAGDNKAFLDPFSPVNEAHRDFAKGMAKEIHEQFISVVKQGRGTRLKGDDPTIFSGLLWTGEKGVELGLADSLGNVDMVARDVIKAERVIDFSSRDNVVERFARRFGAVAAEAFSAALGSIQAPGLQ
jgi:protease IV